ncbi:unnamed protein product [Psylliodes chrysocephalus]|uniref:Uncharacterized protein n=1 Tax=Psylliodes chrysocephalus TaxID=3402493 RepID=A0A9P0DA31_9CUCU|nr:unnamed protein product [Psylliodes chrysocephala]
MEMTSLSEEDKAFLRSQREDQISSSMTGVDKVVVSKIRTKCLKKDKNDLYKNKHYRAIAQMNKTVILDDVSSSSSSAPSDDEDECLPPAKKKLLLSPRLKLLDQTLTSTWDRE